MKKDTLSELSVDAAAKYPVQAYSLEFDVVKLVPLRESLAYLIGQLRCGGRFRRVYVGMGQNWR
jgi:hypothetical protein